MAGTKRRNILKSKKARKTQAMKQPGFTSNYAQKKKFLLVHGGWGFEYSIKPWK